MEVNSTTNGFEALILKRFERLPIISTYVRTRGWHFAVSWLHRLTGAGLAIYLLFHIYTLHSLYTPDIYEAKMKIFSSSFFVMLEWMISIPVIFHAVNGGRLILYEVVGSRHNAFMMRSCFVLSVMYAAVVGLLMAMGNQTVSPVFFWLVAVVISIGLAYTLLSRQWEQQHAKLWKWQRITGAFLLIMIPAHILFTHLNPAAAHDAGVVVMRMQHWFIKLIDLSLLTGILFHAAYGVYSIVTDYCHRKFIRSGVGWGIMIVVLIAGFYGVKLTLTI